MKVTVRLREVDRNQSALVGGKAANLGELTKIAGIVVPEGFCVTTHAFEALVAGSPQIGALVDQLDVTSPGEGAAKAVLCAEIRSLIEQTAIPKALVTSISEF